MFLIKRVTIEIILLKLIVVYITFQLQNAFKYKITYRVNKYFFPYVTPLFLRKKNFLIINRQSNYKSVIINSLKSSNLHFSP